MITIEIQAIPNQSFSFDVDGTSLQVELKTTSFLNATISINNVVVMSGIRVVPYFPIIPYEYLTEGFGNLFLITQDGESPDYTKFGTTQTLVYMTPLEISSLTNVY